MNVFKINQYDKATIFSTKIVNDIVEGNVKVEFMLMANSLSKKELLTRIDHLHEMFSSGNVLSDDFFKTVNSLPTTDNEVVSEVVDFILENNYSEGISLNNYRVALKFADEIRDDERYLKLIHICVANGSLEVVDETLKNGSVLTSEFIEFNKTLTSVNDQYRMYLVKAYLQMLMNKFSIEQMELLDDVISGFSSEFDSELRNILSELLMFMLKQDIKGDDNIKIIINIVKKKLSTDEIKFYTFKALNMNIENISKVEMTIITNNAFKVLFLTKGLRKIRKFLLPVCIKKRHKELHRYLQTIHFLVENPDYNNISSKEVKKTLFEFYKYDFDLSRRSRQKKLTRKFYKIMKINLYFFIEKKNIPPVLSDTAKTNKTTENLLT